MASGSNVVINVGANLNPSQLVRQLQQVQAQHGTFNMTLNTKGFRQPLGRITGDLGEFQNALDASIARTLAFGAAVGVVNGIANAFKSMVSSAIEVEKKLTDVNVILNQSKKGLKDFSAQLFEVAKNTGQSFEAVSDAAVELARQGLGAEETLKRINDAMILTRLSGMDAAKSVETLTAAVNGFGQSALTTTQLVNKLATVDAAFAVSTEDLANALSRAGASAQAAKVNLDQLLAAVTSVQQQTARGGAVIGNAFKSIFTRLQRSGVREALEEIGVATTDAAGNIRGALDVLKDYAGVYKSLTDQQRAYTDELVAGVFQINNLKALVKDLGSGFSIYDRALTQSASATDEATRRNRELGSTLAALVNESAINVKALAASLGSLVATPAIQNLLKVFNSLSEAIAKALDPEKGSKLIQGMFKGIGAFIAGPGLLIVGAAFIKLFKFITGQSVRALKEVFKINTAAQKTKQIEAELSGILVNNTRLYQQISNQSLTRQQREQLVLAAINAETAAYKAQAVIVSQLARSRSVSAGIGARSRAGGGSSAEGFIPNLVNDVEGVVAAERASIGAGVGGASKGAQAKVLPGFPVGGGRKETMVANTDEVIAPNFGGGQGSAIFNPDMIKSMGMPDGAIPVASGFVPNFAQKTILDLIKTQNVGEGFKLSQLTGGKDVGIIAGSFQQKKAGWLKKGATIPDLKEYLPQKLKKKGVPANQAEPVSKKLLGAQLNMKGFITNSILPIPQELMQGATKNAETLTELMNPEIEDAVSAIGSKVWSQFWGNDVDEAAIKTNIKKRARSEKSLISTSAEGAILETAVRLGSKEAAIDVEKKKETARFDFEESGNMSDDMRQAFFPGFSAATLPRADAKRTVNPDTISRTGKTSSMMAKVLGTPSVFGSKDSILNNLYNQVYAGAVNKALNAMKAQKKPAKAGRAVKAASSGFIPNFVRRKKSEKESKLRNRWVKAVMKGEDIGATMGLGRGGTESRATMPQLSKEAQKEFEEDLTQGTGIAGEQLDGKKVGIGTKKAKVAALKATQKDIYGDNVLSKLKGAFGGKWNKAGPSKLPAWLAAPIMISQEKRILDGHHRWATVYARDAIDDGKLGGLSMAANQIDLPIQTLLGLAETYSGAKQAGGATGAASGFIPNFAEKGLTESTAKAEKSAEKVKKEIFQLSLDWGDIVIGTKKLQKEPMNLDIEPRGTTGIRGAAGFIPSFAGALEESIAREKDALAAQGSSAKVYTGQDDRLKGAKNPGGLLVANTRDEPKSGSQGVDRMVSTGRNPKTGGSAEGYVPNFILPALLMGARGIFAGLTGVFKKLAPAVSSVSSKAGGLGNKLQTVGLTIFALQSAASLLNPVLQQFGIQIPSLTGYMQGLSDSFFGIDRALVKNAETIKEKADAEVKALGLTIEKVDSFTLSVNKLNSSLASGNVETMGEFLGDILEKATDMGGIDIGSIFAELGDPQGMVAASQAAKELAQQAQGVKVLEGELALLSKNFQEMGDNKSLNKALKESKITMEGLSKALLSGKDAEGLREVIGDIENASDSMQALSYAFPSLSNEALAFISTTDGMAKKLVTATKDQAAYSLAIKKLQEALGKASANNGKIVGLGSALIKLGDGIERAADSASAALKTLSEAGEIKSKSRVENLQAAGTVSSEDLLRGIAGADVAKSQKKGVAEQKATLEKFAASILKSAEENATTLEGPLQTIVQGIDNGTNTTEISVGLLKELNKETGDSGKSAKAALGALQKINQTQISTQAKIQATLQANLEKLGRQAIFFQRNNILSEQQIKGFSEFRNEFQKGGETAKTQLQKLTDLKNVMTTVEKLTGDDAVLAELREQTKRLTQLEGLRAAFNELSGGEDFQSNTLAGLEEEVQSFVAGGSLSRLDEQTQELFLALQKAFVVAKKFGDPGVVGAGEIKEAATVEISPDALNEMTSRMAEVIGEGNAAQLGITSDLLGELNSSLETNVSNIAQSIASQAEDNAEFNAKNRKIQEETAQKIAASLSGMNLSGASTDLRRAAVAIAQAAEDLSNTSAGGFVPNFAPINPVSKAKATERSLGGQPVVDYHKSIGTYVRDGSSQKNLRDVKRDHPEGVGQAIKNSRKMQGAGRGFVPAFAADPADPDDAEDMDLGELTLAFDDLVKFPSFKKLHADHATAGYDIQNTTAGVPRGPYYKIAGMPFRVSSQGEDWFSARATAIEGFFGFGEGDKGTVGSFLYGVNRPTDGVVSAAKDFTDKLGALKPPSDLVPHPKGAGQAFFQKIKHGGFIGEEYFGGSPYVMNNSPNTIDSLKNPYNKPEKVFEKYEEIISKENLFYKFPVIKGNSDFIPPNLKAIEQAYKSLYTDKWYRLTTEYASRNSAGSDALGAIGSDGNEAGYFSNGPALVDGAISTVPSYKQAIDKGVKILGQDFPDMEIPVGDKETWEQARGYRAAADVQGGVPNTAPTSTISPAYIRALGTDFVARKILSDQGGQFAEAFAAGKRGFLLPFSEFYPTEEGFAVGTDMTEWKMEDLRSGYEWLEKAEAHLTDRLANMPGFGFADPDANKMERQLLNQRRDEVRRVAGEMGKYAGPYDTVASSGGDGRNNSAYQYWLSHPQGGLGGWKSTTQAGENIPLKDLDWYFKQSLNIKDALPWEEGGFIKGAFMARLQESNHKKLLENYKKNRFAPITRLKAAAETWGGREARAKDSATILEGLRATLEEEAGWTDDSSDPDEDVLDPTSTIEEIGVGLELPPIPPPTTEQKTLTEADKVRDNVYRALLRQPILPQKGVINTGAKEAIARALHYKNTLWPARKIKAEERLLNLQNRYEDDRWGDTPSAQKQLALIKKQMQAIEKEQEIYKDEDNALAFFYAGGVGNLDEWTKLPKGTRFDTPDSSYRKMLLRYFGGGPVSDGTSVLETTGDRKLSGKQYLEGFTFKGVKNKSHGNRAEIQDYAKLRGFGGAAGALSGVGIKALIDSLKGKGRSGKLSAAGFTEADSLEGLLTQYGGIELARTIDPAGGPENLQKESFNKIKAAIGTRNPLSKFIIDHMSPEKFWKSELAKKIKGRDQLSGVPLWDFSEIAQGNVILNRKDGEKFKLDAVPPQDREALAGRGQFEVLRRYTEKRKRWLEDSDDNKGTTVMDKILSRTTKKKAQEFAPYVDSLGAEDLQTLFGELLSPDRAGNPTDPQPWKEKYGGEAKHRFKRLIKTSGQTNYGIFEPTKNLKGKNLPEDQARAGRMAVGSIDQGISRDMQYLLFGDQRSPFPYDLDGVDVGQSQGRLKGALHDVSGTITDSKFRPFYAPFGYTQPGSKTPSGTPQMIEDWLQLVGAPAEGGGAGNARGFVPNFSAIAGEIAASRTAGYKSPVTAGQVKSMNIPGIGKTAYNTQESVFRKPGVSQPFIAPPSNSNAASGYKRAVQSKFNFDPYGGAASGFVPNFAGMDLSFLTKGFDKILDAAELFSQQSRSMKEAAKLIKDGAEDLARNQKASFTPLTAATSELNESMRNLATNMPSSVEVETGTLGESMDTLSASLGSVSGSIGLDVKIPNININVAGATSGAITENLKATLNAEIPKIIAAEIRSDSIKKEIEAIALQALGL